MAPPSSFSEAPRAERFGEQDLASRLRGAPFHARFALLDTATAFWKANNVMKTLLKPMLVSLWAFSAVETVCFGADLPLPQYPIVFIHGLASDADTWAELRNFLTGHAWRNGGSPKFVKEAYPTNDFVDGVGPGTF